MEGGRGREGGREREGGQWVSETDPMVLSITVR